MTTLHESDVLAIIADTTKVIAEDIPWKRPSKKLLIQEFRTIIKISNRPDMYLDGWFNPSSHKLSYSLIHPVEGRIYGPILGRSIRTGVAIGSETRTRTAGKTASGTSGHMPHLTLLPPGQIRSWLGNNSALRPT